jgi:hypothetical protein
MGEWRSEGGHASIKVVARVAQALVTFSADLKQRVPVKKVQAERLALGLGQFREPTPGTSTDSADSAISSTSTATRRTLPFLARDQTCNPCEGCRGTRPAANLALRRDLAESAWQHLARAAQYRMLRGRRRRYPPSARVFPRRRLALAA